jgi:hypothetical protein
VKPTPPFTPNAAELELAMVALLTITSDVHVYPHQSHVGLHVVVVPVGTGFERLALR